MADSAAETPSLELPQMCCRCLGDVHAWYEVRGTTHKEHGYNMVTTWELPVCFACRERLLESGRRRPYAIALVAAAVISGLVLGLRFWWLGALLVAASVAGAVKMWGKMMTPPAIVGWTLLDEAQDCAKVNTLHGKVLVCQLPRFANTDYEREFRQLNQIEHGVAAGVGEASEGVGIRTVKINAPRF